MGVSEVIESNVKHVRFVHKSVPDTVEVALHQWHTLTGRKSALSQDQLG